MKPVYPYFILSLITNGSEQFITTALMTNAIINIPQFFEVRILAADPRWPLVVGAERR